MRWLTRGSRGSAPAPVPGLSSGFRWAMALYVAYL